MMMRSIAGLCAAGGWLTTELLDPQTAVAAMFRVLAVAAALGLAGVTAQQHTFSTSPGTFGCGDIGEVR